MNNIELLTRLEGLALQYDFRVVISRSNLGCGWHLYFRDDKSDTHSRPISFFPEKETAEQISAKAEELAIKFTNHINRY